jgi:hypothetical protein
VRPIAVSPKEAIVEVRPVAPNLALLDIALPVTQALTTVTLGSLEQPGVAKVMSGDSRRRLVRIEMVTFE